jgi:hypothetical protein
MIGFAPLNVGIATPIIRGSLAHVRTRNFGHEAVFLMVEWRPSYLCDPIPVKHGAESRCVF